MKTLLLLRHAKSSWKNADLSDHDRPLNERGKTDAPRMGLLLKQNELVPDLIVSSTAKRARKTAEKVAVECSYVGSINLEGELYLAPPSAYIEVLRQVDDEYQRVMAIGHNPGIEELLHLFSGSDAHMHMPTAALARLSLEIDFWRDLNRDSKCVLEGYWCPKDLD